MKVALIVLDATRKDFLTCFGGEPGVTPTIDSLAESGIRFPNCYSGAPWTPASHATMFTGTFPSKHDVRGTDLSYPVDSHYLPSTLRDHGIRTQAIGAEPWLSRDQGVNRGFVRFHDRSKVMENLREQGSHTISDLPTLLRAGLKYGVEVVRSRLGTDYEADRFDLFLFQEWLKQSDSFTFLNIPVAHGPYDPPAPLRGRTGVEIDSNDEFLEEQSIHPYIVGESDLDETVFADLRELYRAGVAHADYLLSRALDGIDDDTWIILTADHGDNLGANQRMGHQFSLHDNLINVPLIVSHPSLDSEICERLVSHVDIAPTVYDIARRSGYDVSPPPKLPGRSLLEPREKERIVFSEYGPPGPHINALMNNTEDIGEEQLAELYQTIRAAMTEEFKLLWYSDGRIELYRRGEEDGPELADERPAVVDRLLDAMERELGPTQEADMNDIDAYVREGVEDKLEALGYL
jgi:arylsulfatase A-like enzyme